MVESGLLEVLRSIDGSTFLGIFLLAGIAALLCARTWMRQDGTSHRPLPSYLNQDSLTIGYLNGRENGVKRAAMFHLYSQGKLVLVDGRGKNTAHVGVKEGS